MEVHMPSEIHMFYNEDTTIYHILVHLVLHLVNFVKVHSDSVLSRESKQ